MVLREPQRGFWASLKQKKRKPVLNLLNASARMFGASEKRRKPVCQSYEDVEIQDNSLGRRQSDDADLLQRAFQKAEIQEPLTVLGSGLEAIRYLSGEGKYENREGFPIPFLIILDLSLPGVDGFEVLRWLRKHPEISRRMTSLVLTGIESQSFMDEAYSLGAQTVLVKPVRFEELVALAKRLKTFWIELNRGPRDPG